MKRNLVYQIFVDRFAGPEGRALDGPPDGGDPWRVHAGGTLDGIAARLDHMVSLGADALYLTPIFRAPSNHKYDTEAFEVDPCFGGEAAFGRLASACAARGLGLILDGVFNHVGEAHAWARERSEWLRPGSFWRGYALPELELAHPELLDVLVDGEASVVRTWLRRGATGWRLDCANDLGLEVCGRIARAVAAEGGVDGAVGEVMAWAEPFVAEGRLDGVMNYWFRETVVGLCRGDLPAAQAAVNLKRQAGAYRREGLLRSWNVLGTHDTARLATVVPTWEARALAIALAFTAPGVPLLYYGDEVGMSGGPDPDNRRVMRWEEGSWDRRTLEWVRRLASVRRGRRALAEGSYLSLPQPGHPALLTFARATGEPEETVLVVANTRAEPFQGRVFAPVPDLFDAVPLHDLVEAAEPTAMQAGAFSVSLGPWQVALYAPRDGTISGYRFFKRR